MVDDKELAACPDDEPGGVGAGIISLVSNECAIGVATSANGEVN
jgi:hypothetical protein